MKQAKSFRIFTLITTGLLLLIATGCDCNKQTEKPVVEEGKTSQTGDPEVSALPNNSFYCLRAGKDTVERWLTKTAGGQNKHSRIVFSYYWPNRANSAFTLISFMNEKGNTQYAPKTDTLKTISTCLPSNLGTAIVLGSNELPLAVIIRLWNYSSDPGRYLRFTPIISQERSPDGTQCCINNLVYRVDLILSNGQTPQSLPGAAYDPGYSNPSPPKEPTP